MRFGTMSKFRLSPVPSRITGWLGRPWQTGTRCACNRAGSEMLLNEAEMIHACKTVDLCLSVVNHPLFHTARIFQLPQTNYPNALALMFPYVGVKGVVLSCLDHRDYSTIETVTTSSPFGLHCKKTALWNSGCFSAKNWSKIKQWESSSHGASYLCRMDPEDQCGNDVPAARLASVLATKGIRSLPVKTCTV